MNSEDFSTWEGQQEHPGDRSTVDLHETRTESLDTVNPTEMTQWGDEMVYDDKGAAKRADRGKLRYDLMPPQALEDIVQILTFGAEKYGDRNWEGGMAWSRCYGSMMRHIQAWWSGEDVDSESGEHHLAHAACNLIFLMEYTRTKSDLDDRPGDSNG